MKRGGISILFIRSHLRALSLLLDHLFLFECVCGVGFESILKRCLCNGFRFYKNAYKVLSFENVSK